MDMRAFVPVPSLASDAFSMYFSPPEIGTSWAIYPNTAPPGIRALYCPVWLSAFVIAAFAEDHGINVPVSNPPLTITLLKDMTAFHLPSLFDLLTSPVIVRD